MRELIRHPYWVRSKTVMLVLLGLWVSYAFAVQMFVTALNKITIPILGLPLGIYLAMQGSLVVLAVLVFWFSRKPT